ncbi:MAG: LeuA family protein [Candidatus Bipolaricaulia bacterium]
MEELIYDWNAAGGVERPGKVELNDESLRDGLQSPSITNPPIEKKLVALHYMAELGIPAADIGMPATSPQAKEETLQLAKEIVKARLNIRPNCAARTVIADVEPVVEISQRAGIAVEASTFIGSSAIRKLAEGWDMEAMLRNTEEAVSFAVKNNLPVMYVTEDTTRAAPDVLKKLYTTALDNGAYRLCIADTVGHCTPRGARRLIEFIKKEVIKEREGVQIDWHGHNDRGLAVANSLAAFEAGADCVHATVLGIGERIGNTPLDILLVNLKLLGWIDNDLKRLPEYCQLIAEVTGAPFPFNYPAVGKDAFRTATGVHAAAVIKALRMKEDWLANLVYSSVPADMLGRRQEIEIGPLSGRWNVVYWLESRGIEPEEGLIDKILEQAKGAKRVLPEGEVKSIVENWRGGKG